MTTGSGLNGDASHDRSSPAQQPAPPAPFELQPKVAAAASSGPVAASVKFPLVVRYGKAMGYVMIGSGSFWMIATLAVGQGTRFGGLIGGGLILVVGIMQSSGQDYVVIQKDSVIVKSQIGTTTKTVPINGIQDLQVLGKRLVRRSDGKKIAKIVALGTDHDDAAAVTAALANATPETSAR